jgi:hypothetical protein
MGRAMGLIQLPFLALEIKEQSIFRGTDQENVVFIAVRLIRRIRKLLIQLDPSFFVWMRILPLASKKMEEKP